MLLDKGARPDDPIPMTHERASRTLSYPVTAKQWRLLISKLVLMPDMLRSVRDSGIGDAALIIAGRLLNGDILKALRPRSNLEHTNKRGGTARIAAGKASLWGIIHN